MKYVTATRAAQIIGVTPRTISTWVAEGKLTAHRPEGKKNQLAIPELEVEAIARERGQYREEDAKETPDIAPLKQEIENLKQEVQSLKNELRRISENRPVEVSAYDDTSEKVRPQKRIVAPEKALPDGAIPAREFAAMYGVKPETFRDHYTKGIGYDKEKAQISSRPKPGREYNTEWFVMPDEVQGVLDFWRRHSSPFHEPETQLSIWQETDKQEA